MSYPAKININFMDQISYLQGLHRSGWPYVLRQLVKLQSDDGIWCDTYVDRTFHWARPSLIPYTRPWIGFIHHTFNTEFSDYNNVKLLENENFITSLQECKGLFVFSRVEKTRWINELSLKNIHVPVTELVHPTEIISNKFTMEKFNVNKKKQIVQVGAWLRDNYAIFALNNGKHELILKDGTIIEKSAIVGPSMQHYFKPLDFFRHFREAKWKKSSAVPPVMTYSSTKTILKSNDETIPTKIESINGEIPIEVFEQHEQNSGDGMCRDLMCRDSDYGLNKYVKGAVDLLESYDESVSLLPSLADSDYDEILNKNLIFIKLVDAAAVNTVIECIVRNTPIVINPLPAVVEMLGASYPLYFNNITQVPGLLTTANITTAYNYLNNLDKSFLTAEHFLNTFANSQIYQAL